jgi:hypothetical protein
MKSLLFLSFATILATAGCGAAPGVNMPRGLSKTASFEMSCPAEDLVGTNLGSGAHGVQGCGKKATYICTKVSWGGACSGTWVLSSKE